MYQVLTKNKSEYSDDEMEAFDIYNEYVETYGHARLYEEGSDGKKELIAAYE